MHLKWFNRIRWRLLISFAAVIVMVIAILALVSGFVLREVFLTRLEDDMSREARQFATTLETLAAAESDVVLEPVQLENLTRRTGTAADTRITVVARDGKVLADSELDPATLENHAQRPEVARALSGNEGRARRFSETLDADFLYVAVPLGESDDAWSQGAVRVALPASRVDPALGDVRRLPLLVGLIMLLPVLGLAYLLSNSFIRPIEQLKSMATHVTAGELDYRVRLSRKDELGELGQAFNEMARELDGQVSDLASQHAETDSILTAMSDAVLLLDASGRVIKTNPAAAKLLGCSVETLEGSLLTQAARDLCSGAFFQQALTTEEALRGRLEFRGDRSVSVQAIPLAGPPPAKRQLLLVLRDETDRVRTEQIRRDFVANVSHELKTPLAGLNLIAATLRRAIAEDPEYAQQFAERLVEETGRLSGLVDDLLVLSQVEERSAAVRELPAQLVDLAAVARSVAEELAPRAVQAGRNLHVDADAPVMVAGEAAALETLVRNLVDNAIRYTEEDGNIWVSVRRETDSVDGSPTTVARLAVRDDGIGIPRADQARIFERFYRVDKARSRQTGGTGLGLSIVKHIAERHGGRVEVESTLGIGSTFTLTLEAAQEAHPRR